MAADYTRCRTLGHAWYDYDSHWTSSLGGTPVTFRCERCGTERRETWSPLGDLMSRRYEYPDSYRYGKGEKPSIEQFRLALLSLRTKEARSTRKRSPLRAVK